MTWVKATRVGQADIVPKYDNSESEVDAQEQQIRTIELYE